MSFAFVPQIDLAVNRLGPEGAKALAPGLRDSGSLTVADLRFNQLDTESATMLANIAKEKKISLCGITPEQTTANLRGEVGKRMGPADAILLTADLAVRNSLTRLLIGDNSIENEGCTALAKAMQLNESCKIEELNLSSNSIKFTGAKALAAMIAVRNSLTQVLAFSNMLWIGE